MSGLRRTKGLKRARPTARKTPVKKRNLARRKSEFARAYGSTERVTWVRALGCLVARGPWAQWCNGSVENAHVATGGMGRKSDAANIVPLCVVHHSVLHAAGVRLFERGYCVDLAQEAARVETDWQSHVAGDAGTTIEQLADARCESFHKAGA